MGIDSISKILDNKKTIIAYELNSTNLLKKIIESICKDNKVIIITRKEIISENKEVLPISTLDFNELINIYFLYDFSDKINYIGENEMIPSIYNYVQQGILTEEEMIEALLKE